MPAFLLEFLCFGLKEARACMFAIIFFSVLALSYLLPLGGLARYDFIFLALLVAQLLLLAMRVETLEEAGILTCFHLLGLGLELFKTHPAIRSWSYPEPRLLRIATVPLYSGFMCAAVASYMCQAWGLLRLRLTRYPSYWLSVPLCGLIYLNFFTQHGIGDLRWPLFVAVVVVFAPTIVWFTPQTRERGMPLLLAFGLIACFVWLAENIATLLGAWVYPDQRDAWTLVSLNKLSSWSLLVIVSFLLVADLKHRQREPRQHARP